MSVKPRRDRVGGIDFMVEKFSFVLMI